MSNVARAAISSLAVHSPSTLRTNAFFRSQFPDVVRSAEDRALNKVWAVRPGQADSLTAFETAMLPYLSDPFRGTRERRVLGEGETTLTMLTASSRLALAAAGLAIQEIDLLICCAFPSGQVGIGEAAFLARELGYQGAAWNAESACSSASVGLEIADAMVKSRQYRHVLVSTACAYSQVTEPDDTLAWTSGDGSASFIVSNASGGSEVLSAQNLHTAESCDAICYEVTPGAAHFMRMKTYPRARDSLRDIAERTVDICSRAAAVKAGVSLTDISLFVCNTPTAWFAAFVASKLGVPRERVVDTHPMYGNIGPALWPTALHHAAREGRMRSGDLVMIYSVGSVASSSAIILRWGDVKLGPPVSEPLLRL